MSVGDDRGTGQLFSAVIRLKRRSGEYLPHHMHAIDRRLLVPFVHEIVGLDDGRRKRIGRTGTDEAATVRAQLIEPDLDDRNSFRSIRSIVSEGKIKLNIGR